MIACLLRIPGPYSHDSLHSNISHMVAMRIGFVQREESKSLELDEVIDSLRHEIHECRRLDTDTEGMRFKIHISENRLHEWILRFNQTLSDNTGLKEQIELLRKEKGIFQSIHAKMVKELETQNAEISQVIEKSNSAYAARDLAQSQMGQLKAQADKEHAEFEKEWNELARLIENDKKMREFIQQKDLFKHHRSADSRGSPSTDSKPETPITPPVDVGSVKAQIAELQSVFEAIRLATGISSIEQLLVYFVTKEKRNYSLFGKSNLNIADLEKAQVAIDLAKRDIVRYRGISTVSPAVGVMVAPVGSADSDDGTKAESILVSCERKAEEFGLKIILLNKLVSSIRIVIQSIFECSFANSNYREYLNSAVVAASVSTPIGSVTEANLIDYLAAIETRVDECVAEYLQRCPVIDLKKAAKDAGRMNSRKSISSVASATKVAAPAGSSVVMHQILQYRLPSAVDDDANDDDVAHCGAGGDDNDHLRPLTRSELRSRTMESIQRNQERNKMKRSNSKYIK